MIAAFVSSRNDCRLRRVRDYAVEQTVALRDQLAHVARVECGRLRIVPLLQETLSLLDHDLRHNAVETAMAGPQPKTGARFFFELRAAP